MILRKPIAHNTGHQISQRNFVWFSWKCKICFHFSDFYIHKVCWYHIHTSTLSSLKVVVPYVILFTSLILLNLEKVGCSLYNISYLFEFLTFLSFLACWLLLFCNSSMFPFWGQPSTNNMTAHHALHIPFQVRNSNPNLHWIDKRIEGRSVIWRS